MRGDGAIRHLESIASTEERADNVMAGVLIDVTERAHAAQREHDLQRQLRERSHQAGMAEIATGVLHNVGNVLNSLGIANATIRRELNELRLERLEQTSGLIREHRGTLASFLTEDPHGKHLPGYLDALTGQIAAKVRAARLEAVTVDQLLHHLRDIVSAQQASAKIAGIEEPVDLRELLETAILVEAPVLDHIEVVRQYEELPAVTTDRHKLLQILVNFLSNARHAVQAGTTRPGRITLQLLREDAEVLIGIEDSGVGMSAEVVSQLWRYGFTTKPDGHGFGLHNCANAARLIGASVEATSAGPDRGARFVIRLPVNGAGRRPSG